MTREELKEAMSDLYAYAFADGRKSVGTVRDEDAGDHCTLGFESWFEYVYAPIQLTPTLTLDPATNERIGVDDGIEWPKGLHGPLGFYDLPDGVTPEMVMAKHLKTCNQCRYERGMELLPNGLTKEEIETMRAWFDK
jgi:hypothetical protein